MDTSNDLSLSGVLDSLRIVDDNGHVFPNITARRQLLDELIHNGLLGSEIRHMREQLCAIPLPTKDIFRYLPQELQMQVVEHLDFATTVSMTRVSRSWRSSLFQEKLVFFVIEKHPNSVKDILGMAYVSKAWRNVLLQETIILLLTKRHFRHRWYQYSSALPRQSTEDLRDWLTDTIETLARQRLPTIVRCYQPHWKGEKIDTSRHNGIFGYANGRVAYRYDKQSIVVHSLRKTKDAGVNDLMFMHKDRLLLQKWLLSDQMILAEISSPRRLMIRSFMERESHDITLPSGIKYWIAKGQDFAIVTETHEILSGTVDGSCKIVSGLQDTISGQKLIPIGIRHHPVEEKCFYVFYTVKAGDRLITQEVLNGSASITPFETQFPKHDDWITRTEMSSIQLYDFLLTKGIVVAIRPHRVDGGICFDMYSKQYSSQVKSTFYYDEPIPDRERSFLVLFRTQCLHDDLIRGLVKESFYMVCCYDADAELVEEGSILPDYEGIEFVNEVADYYAGVDQYQRVREQDHNVNQPV